MREPSILNSLVKVIANQMLRALQGKSALLDFQTMRLRHSTQLAMNYKGFCSLTWQSSAHIHAKHLLPDRKFLPLFTPIHPFARG